MPQAWGEGDSFQVYRIELGECVGAVVGAEGDHAGHSDLRITPSMNSLR
jgi:hypothetical protein